MLLKWGLLLLAFPLSEALNFGKFLRITSLLTLRLISKLFST